MMFKPLAVVLLLAVGGLNTGCASVAGRLVCFINEGQPDGFAYKSVYPGLQVPGYIIDRYGREHEGWTGVAIGVCILDMPLSFVLDTALLPIDLGLWTLESAIARNK